jgi:predicted esterase
MYETRHGHSERTRILMEELLCLPTSASSRNVVLIGHSQGGAVSASVCSYRVVQSANIRGGLTLFENSANITSKCRPYSSRI